MGPHQRDKQTSSVATMCLRLSSCAGTGLRSVTPCSRELQTWAQFKCSSRDPGKELATSSTRVG
eukprot:2544605-Lingulodinium_polyedra.AAC.1